MRHGFLHIFFRFSAWRQLEITKFEIMMMTWPCNRESFNPYFHSETARTNLFLGHFAHNVRRERDGIIAKDLYWIKIILRGDLFVVVAVVHFKVPILVLGRFHCRSHSCCLHSLLKARENCFNICSNTLFDFVEQCWLTGWANGFKTPFNSFNIESTLFQHGFNIAVQQNRTDVEANVKG